MNQESSHLRPEELIAAARGEPVGSLAAGHLAACGDCAGEVRTWNAVAGGMRVRVARSTPPDRIIGQVLAALDEEPPQPAPVPAKRSTQATGEARPGSHGHRYRWLAVAAAVAVLAGGGYGASRGLGSAGGGPASVQADATLTATACSGLKAVGGTLTSVNGSTLTIRATDGGPVTVTASEHTKVVREVAGTLSDITDGAPVTVLGTNTGTAIEATSVALRNETTPSLGKLPASPAGGGGPALRLGLASGTVADMTGSGFTVDEPGGSRVQVTTSPATSVLTLVTSSIGELEDGKLTSAVGAPGPDGTLAATLVEQDDLTAPPAPPSPPGKPQGLPGSLPEPGRDSGSSFPSPPVRPSPGNPGSLFAGLGCSQDSITTTYLMSLASQGH